MRRIGIVAAILALAAAVWIWPYLGAYSLAQAALRHDTTAVAARLNEPALKRSLARQIVAAYLAKSGRGDHMGGFQRGLATAVGASVASPYLDQLLTPDAIATLLGQGRIGALTIGDRQIAINREVPSLSALYDGHLADVVLHSFYDGLLSFRLSVPATAGSDGAYGIHLRLSGLTWQLSGLDLPGDVLDRIATDAIAAEHGAAQTSP
ncbi:DUF2939 domain-containing protein [Lichenihabitans sp. Uapishka_5]|uniref:DUF2939 domain-containing protein n=1 Tax=Lichenihabitans sp. Uapishka_5 TaxID=3037302 RepID=UPI0029E81DE6|nr:DUF2939 domain-containing protein [Lichenihabitans sp. Uapishka_5]MDX7950706.1 DUF2939 domain-containing protein [Lichenihabitans sp. Uapishka_5]